MSGDSTNEWYRYLFSGSRGWSILNEPAAFDSLPDTWTSPWNSAASPLTAPPVALPAKATIPEPPLLPAPLPCPPAAVRPGPPMPLPLSPPVASTPEPAKKLVLSPPRALMPRPASPVALLPPVKSAPSPPVVLVLSPPRVLIPNPPSLRPLPASPPRILTPAPLAAVLTTSRANTSGACPISDRGMATPNGKPFVPLPVNVPSWEIEPRAAVVCIVPSGNFNPSAVVSIIPATVSLDDGESVPSPTLPSLSSNIVESPITELVPKPVHFVMRPKVPPPITGRLTPAAGVRARVPGGSGHGNADLAALPPGA